ncbi:MAG: hypothetical protein ABFS08_11520 [Pseudomonadota bacterium]
MSDNCCESSQNKPREAACPGCQQAGATVEHTTLLHQLTTPWQQSLSDAQYYFCAQPGCEVVYFNTDGSRFTTKALRQPVGQKSEDARRIICYCFDIHLNDLADPQAAKQSREFVIKETRNKACACEMRNPSGRCCLRDFPKQKE